jgi:hypothetical protein
MIRDEQSLCGRGDGAQHSGSRRRLPSTSLLSSSSACAPARRYACPVHVSGGKAKYRPRARVPTRRRSGPGALLQSNHICSSRRRTDGISTNMRSGSAQLSHDFSRVPLTRAKWSQHRIDAMPRPTAIGCVDGTRPCPGPRGHNHKEASLRGRVELIVFESALRLRDKSGNELE